MLNRRLFDRWNPSMNSSSSHPQPSRRSHLPHPPRKINQSWNQFRKWIETKWGTMEERNWRIKNGECRIDFSPFSYRSIVLTQTRSYPHLLSIRNLLQLIQNQVRFPIIRESNPWSLVKCWSNRLIPFPTIGFSSLLTSWHSYKRDRSKLTTPPKQKSSLIFSSLAWSHEWRRNSDRTTELIDLSIICSIAP